MDRDVTAIIAMSLLFGGPMCVWLISVLSDSIVKVVCHWRDTTLKLKLAQSGVSAKEIERIVLAGRTNDEGELISRALEEPEPNKVGAPKVPEDKELAWDA